MDSPARSLRSTIQGPYNQGERDSLTVRDVHINTTWDLSKISFDFSQNVIHVLNSNPIDINNLKEDTIVWSLTSNDLFSTSSVYD